MTDGLDRKCVSNAVVLIRLARNVIKPFDGSEENDVSDNSP